MVEKEDTEVEKEDEKEEAEDVGWRRERRGGEELL